MKLFMKVSIVFSSPTTSFLSGSVKSLMVFFLPDMFRPVASAFLRVSPDGLWLVFYQLMFQGDVSFSHSLIKRNKHRQSELYSSNLVMCSHFALDPIYYLTFHVPIVPWRQRWYLNLLRVVILAVIVSHLLFQLVDKIGESNTMV